MTKLADIIFDAIDIFVEFYGVARKKFWEIIDAYNTGSIQTWARSTAGWTSWILIGLAMWLISSLAHYIGFETLDDEFFIFLILVGIRYTAKWGF